MTDIAAASPRPNRLIRSSSPYLLQHAHNPVDWREWGAEAFEEARRLDRPIFLSVGYSTCYWCHVMEREVFEHTGIARLMNENFVCVKVDREQRPDVDEVYMAATQIATGHGGWPNSVFLTPELKPFYAGTYFGPTDQFGRPGFPRVLGAIASAWRESRADVEKQSAELAGVIRQVLGERMSELAKPALDSSLVEKCVEEFIEAYDPRDGGFGQAPKFPQGFVYPLLCDVVRAAPSEQIERMISFSLRRMAQGGLFDQIGGGFHRYSTDARWLVPHFEKMLYDQALLVGAYAAAAPVVPGDEFRRAASATLAFVAREMTGPAGQFFSAIDAETEGKEGQFYLWTDEQLKAALSPAEFDLFAQVYGLAEIPHIKGHPTPDGGAVWMRGTPATLAAEIGTSEAELWNKLGPILTKLLAIRDERPRPLLDTKVIASWNGLMIDACVRAFEAFGDPEHLRMAERAAGFAAKELVKEENGSPAVRRESRAEIDGFQEDYAALARGFLAVGRASKDAAWVDRAQRLLESMHDRFFDRDSGAYFFAAPDPHLIARGMSPTDGAVPSGNSMAAHAWLDLHALRPDPRSQERADAVLRAFAGLMGRSPSGVAHMTHALHRRLLQASAGPSSGRPSPVAAEIPGTGSGSKVRSWAVAGRENGEIHIALALDVAQGWHVNANPAAPGLQPFVVDVRADFAIESVRVEHPAPDEGSSPPSWSGRAVVLASVTPARPVTAAESLRVLHTFQACSDAACLATETRVITVAPPEGAEASKNELRRRAMAGAPA